MSDSKQKLAYTLTCKIILILLVQFYTISDFNPCWFYTASIIHTRILLSLALLSLFNSRSQGLMKSTSIKFSEHWQPSSMASDIEHMHVDHLQHSMELENTEVLTTEPRRFERGVKEAIYIRALNPSFNRNGGRYDLVPVWDNIIKKKVKADRPRRGVASSLLFRTTSPRTSPGRLNWWS